MAIKIHEPLDTDPIPMSVEKRVWCASPWTGRGSVQPRIAVFHYVMNATRRPSSPNETLAFAVMNNNKLHDREPTLIIESIEKIDENYFNDYPRRSTTEFDMDFKKGVISELVRAFYRHGFTAYGKPGLRKDPDNDSPLAVL